MSMNITLHLSGIGHRRFCGADAAEQAERWSHDARCRAIDEDAEELAAIKRQQAISTPTARSLLGHLKRLGRPADIPELGTPVDQDKLIEQYRTTCEAQQQTIERLRGMVQRAEAGGCK